MKPQHLLPILAAIFFWWAFSEGERPPSSRGQEGDARWDANAQAYLDSLRAGSNDTLAWCATLDEAALAAFRGEHKSPIDRFRQSVAFYKLSLSLRAQIAQRDPWLKANLEQTIRSYTNLANFAMQFGFFREGEGFINAGVDSIKLFQAQGRFYNAFRAGRAYHVSGRIAEELWGPKKAEEAYQKSLACFGSATNEERDPKLLGKDVADLYNDMGTLFAQWEEWDRAAAYADSAINRIVRIYEENPGDETKLGYMSESLPTYLRTKAEICRLKGELEQSNHFYHTVRFILNSFVLHGQEDGHDAAKLGASYSQAVKACRQIVSNGKAPSFPTTTIAKDAAPDEFKEELVKLNIDQSLSLKELSKWKESEALLKEALQINDGLMGANMNFQHLIYQAKILHNLGELHLMQGRHEENLALQDSAQNILRRDSPFRHGSLHYLLLAEILRIKAASQIALGQPQAAVSTYDSALAILEVLQERYVGMDAKMKLRKTHQKIFDGAIGANLAAGNEEQAFQLAEKNKAYTLLQNIRAQENMKDIPPGLLERANVLRHNLQSLQDEMIVSSAPGPLEEKAAGLEAQLAETLSELERSEAYRKAYSTAVLSSQQAIRRVVGKGRALVAYHVGESSTTIFLLSKGGLRTYSARLGREEIRRLEEAVYHGIYTRQEIVREQIQAETIALLGNDCDNSREGKRADPEALIRQYAQAAKQLYDSLFQPVEPVLASLAIREVILIPDDALNRVPFAALVTGLPEGELALYFTNYSFLIDKYAFSYGHSATMLNELKDAAAPEGKRLLAIAPSFGQQTGHTVVPGSCYVLKNTNIDPGILDFFPGDKAPFFGKQAKKEHFEQCFEGDSAGKNGIALIYTHGILDDNATDGSHIMFAQGDTVDMAQALLQRDIYGMSIPLRLMLLFACDTNRGKIQPGEGMASFARALNYAGVRSIIAPYWAISDGHYTRQIIEGLLTGLGQQSVSPAVALREAQAEVIKAEKNPYYWAAFAYVGHPDGFETRGGRKISRPVILALAIVASLFVLVGIRRKIIG